jgi:hypothetical protein
MKNIENSLGEYLHTAEKNIQEVLFVPVDEHPVWEDHSDILELASKQILQPVGILPDENIFAYIGVHSQTIITGKRDSVGFLITNFRILTQTDFSIIGTAEVAEQTLFTQNINPQELLPKVWESFIAKNKLLIPGEQLVAMHSALKNVLEIIVSQLQQLHYLPDEIVKSGNINGRIKELGLEKSLKTYEQDEKRLKKFAEKYNLSDILFGIVDKPFFGGVYGLVITKNGIVSRDLMEDSFSSTWQEIKNNPATLGEKNDVILAGEKRHIIPSHAADAVHSLIILMNELANGEIKIQQ